MLIKYYPPPPNLPVYGKIDSSKVNFIGITNYKNALEEKRYIFGIKRKDRRRHIYIIGKSGVGKSKLLEIMARQDIAYGYGLCFIDPHGDVINNLLDFIPQNRIKDVVLIDPSDKNFPLSFNPLYKVDPELKYQFSQDLIEIIKKTFGANWSPRLEHVLRFVTLALLDYPKATMQGMISLLTDRNYRHEVINFVEDDLVKKFWAVEFADWSQKFDTEAIIPLVNKLGQFLANPLLRHIFGQKENKLNFDDLINKQKIILVNLSKGLLGEENSSFLGSVIITKIKQAGMARAKLKEEQRKDFYVYIDEFQNVVTDTFENLLAESRKYGICLTLAHQYMGQIPLNIRSAVLGNAGTIIVFRVGGEDAVLLKPEMAPIFDVKDMINLGTKEFYIKMTIDGEAYDPFSAETLKVLPPPHKSFKKEIIKFSRLKYAIPIEELKKHIYEEKITNKQEISNQKNNNDIEPIV